MEIRDILQIEHLKYLYEQAYAMHRHKDMPELFVKSDDTVFTLPSAGDLTVGWEKINEKFTEELHNVSPREDSYHTGWQICTPFVKKSADGKIRGIFPTFGYLVLSLDPELFTPPYDVISSLELWKDLFEKEGSVYKIKQLQAQFLLGQCIWKWDPRDDDTVATRHEMNTIVHPYWGRDDRAKLQLLNGDPKTASCECGAGGGTYYGVQFAQSVFLLLWENGEIDKIPDRVFASSEEVSVRWECEGEGTGQEGIRAFFSGMQEKTRKAGGFLRADLPATQFVEPAGDGNRAISRFTTMTKTIIEGGKTGWCIGCFDNEYVKEKCIWRIVHITWKKVIEFEPVQETPDRNLAAYRENPEAWLNTIPKLYALPDRSACAYTERVLCLRNRLLGLFDRYNREQFAGEGDFECGTGGGLYEELRTHMGEIFKSCLCILATSPVISIHEDKGTAEAFFSISLIKKKTDDFVTDIRGSLYIELKAEAIHYNIEEVRWYPYAELAPWKIV